MNPEEGAAELRWAGGCRARKRLRAPEVGVSGFIWLTGGTGEGDGVIVKGLAGLQRRLDVIPSVMGAPRFHQRVSWFRDALWRGPGSEPGVGGLRVGKGLQDKNRKRGSHVLAGSHPGQQWLRAWTRGAGGDEPGSDADGGGSRLSALHEDTREAGMEDRCLGWAQAPQESSGGEHDVGNSSSISGG